MPQATQPSRSCPANSTPGSANRTGVSRESRRHLLIYVQHSRQKATRTHLTSTIRSIPTGVLLTEADGLPGTCIAKFDNIQTVPKSNNPWCAAGWGGSFRPATA